MAIHAFEQVKAFPAYCASKNAGTLLVQLFAQGVSPDDMQILSFHPGAIWTDSVQKSGVPKEAYAWDDGMYRALLSFSLFLHGHRLADRDIQRRLHPIMPFGQLLMRPSSSMGDLPGRLGMWKSFRAKSSGRGLKRSRRTSRLEL